MAVKFVGLLVIFVGLAAAEVIETSPCPESSDACTIHEVRIDPCKENPNTCVIKKGKSAAISFEYTTNFAADKLKSMVYLVNSAVTTPFDGMDYDACTLTPCPAEQNKRQTYNYQLNVSKKLPAGLFPIKWKLWNADDESQVCCFLTAIRLKK